MGEPSEPNRPLASPRPVLLILAEPHTEPVEAALQLGTHGPWRAAEPAGDLFDLEILDVAQPDHLAIGAGQLLGQP
jgi:hypothetical protein